jgi:molybdopterin synthase sulfur carrier subunit
MSVKVVFLPYLQRFTDGRASAKATGQTIGECIENLEIQFPGIRQQLCDDQGQLFSTLEIYVDSDNSYTQDLAKPVKDGDELIIIPIIGGG